MLSLSKRNQQVGIGLIVMGVALITFAFPYQMLVFLDVARGLQLTATGALLFGVLRKEEQHKDKFLLFWLLISTFLLAALAISSFDYISDGFTTFDSFDFINSLLTLCGEWLAALVVAYMMYLIFLDYEECRRQNNSVAAQF